MVHRVRPPYRDRPHDAIEARNISPVTDDARAVQRIYLVLTLLTTLAASFIWGVTTLFLLDAGLNNTEAFAANAFFAVGQVIFEIPTGVVTDTRGRRFSFLLGAATLLLSTMLYHR
jgi:MFS family permease